LLKASSTAASVFFWDIAFTSVTRSSQSRMWIWWCICCPSHISGSTLSWAALPRLLVSHPPGS